MVRRRRRQRAGEPQYELGRGAVYSRISNPGDRREASLETQEAAAVERVEAMGYAVTDEDIFRDRFTGKETIRRPALNRLRERIRDGTYKAVGVYKLDRLSRNMGQTFILLSEMDEHNVRPLSVMEPDIDNSPTGKIMRVMGAYVGEVELATLEDRFGRGREDIFSRGLPLQRGATAYGLVFHKRTRTYTHDEDDDGREGTAKWARLIFELAKNDWSAHAIAVHLNDLGVTPPGLARGYRYTKRPHTGRWSAPVVAKILRNPIYKGWSVENKWYSDGIADAGHSIMRPIPEDEWVVYDREGKIVPPLVDAESWAAANATLDLNAENRSSHGKKVNDYLLGGLIYCEGCGAKRYGFTNRHGTVIYRCANHTLVVQRRRPEAMRCRAPHVRGAWIEPAVWGQLAALLSEPGRLEAAILRELAREPEDRSEADLGMARANLKEQERIRDKFFRKWREEEARPDPDPELCAKWEADYRAMRGPIESLKKTVHALELRVEAMVSPEKVARQIAEKFGSIRERILSGEELSRGEKRAALVAAKTRVTAQGVEGRRPAGSGRIDFYLFNEGVEPGSSPERLSRMNSPVSVKLNL